MTYRLIYNAADDAVHSGLPQHAREQLSVALAAACEDPIAATQQYGQEDGGIMRTLLAGDVMAILLIGHTLKTIRVLQITYLG